jgi:hypothetical protein
MNETRLPIDVTTMQAAERIAQVRQCTVEDVVREAILQYGTAPLAEPESELAITVPMPVCPRPVIVRIRSRAKLAPAPVLPEVES